MGKIQLTGADNARDLGGIRTADGAVIRKGYLIRSNRLSRITKKDIQILKDQYHLHKIIDLRTPMDVGRILRTFKIKKNVEVTDNGKIII